MVEENKNVDWNLFGSEYVGLEEGEAVDLLMTNWHLTEREFSGEKKVGVAFDVLEVDGKKNSKKLDVFSKRLLKHLKPILQDAERQGLTEVKVRITKSGSGFSTNYSVKRL